MTQHILIRTVKRGWQRCCALLTLTLLAIGTHAQTWTASVPAAGEFYLYNVGRAAFLVGATITGLGPRSRSREASP